VSVSVNCSNINKTHLRCVQISHGLFSIVCEHRPDTLEQIDTIVKEGFLNEVLLSLLNLNEFGEQRPSTGILVWSSFPFHYVTVCNISKTGTRLRGYMLIALQKGDSIFLTSISLVEKRLMNIHDFSQFEQGIIQGISSLDTGLHAL